MNQREKIVASIEFLSELRDNLVVILSYGVNPELRYKSDLLMWLIEQLQQSLLVLNAIPDE